MFVGRVVCEVEGGHLNDTSVVLEGDTARSEGARVALDLSSTASFRLFPGQVGNCQSSRKLGQEIKQLQETTCMFVSPCVACVEIVAANVQGAQPCVLRLVDKDRQRRRRGSSAALPCQFEGAVA
jgi:hypothetical protein